jgi:hypothetical protein
LKELQDSRTSSGLRALHRSRYYQLLCALESRVYRQKNVRLAAVSQHAANQLSQYFGRQDVATVPNGVDLPISHPPRAFGGAPRRAKRYAVPKEFP